LNGKSWCRNSKPVLTVWRPFTHVRSFENCQRLLTRKPKLVQFCPTVEYGVLPPKVITGGPAVVSTRPPWLLPQSVCGQLAPADNELPPMNQRS
jgi:hypothetical protein